MNINLLAPINQLGYGVASLNILENLVEMGHEVALFPIGGSVHEVPEGHRDLVARAQAHAGFFDEHAASVRVWHQHALAEHVGNGTRVGFPFFELRQLLPNELHHMRSLDRLVVASKWAADICQDHGLDRPTVAPLGVDRRIFHEGLRPVRLDPDHTVFVNVGKWEVRKGHDFLISAFNRAFGPHDKVILKLATHNPLIGPAGNQKWLRMCSGSRLGKQISVKQDRFRSQRELATFLTAADAAVFPSRAEGWNLELLEAMSCGLPCIATDYSAHTEFVTEANCRLIAVEGHEVARDGVWFNGQGEWALLGPSQEDQLVEHMRAIHRAKQSGHLTTNVAGVETATRFTWRDTATTITGILRDE